MARSKNDLELQKYGMDVLTVAVLSILITAPIGALLISLLGPRLLQKPKNPEWGEIFVHTHSHTLATLLDTPVQLLVMWLGCGFLGACFGCLSTKLLTQRVPRLARLKNTCKE